MILKNKITVIFLFACLFRFDASAQTEKVAFHTFYDSLSYSFGVESALQVFRVNPNFSSLNKVALIEGFQTNLSGEALDENCESSLKKLVGFNGQEFNLEYLREGSASIGSIVAFEFYKTMNDIEYLVDIDLSLVLKGFRDGVMGKSEKHLSLATQASAIAAFSRMVEEDMIADIERKDKRFWSEVLKKKGLKQVGETGIYVETIEEGTGDSPIMDSDIEAHYILTNTEGDTLESSYANGKSLKINLSQVIDGWREGFPALKKGGKYILYVPYEKAYKGGRAEAPQGALCFFIEFIDFGARGTIANPPPTIKRVEH